MDSTPTARRKPVPVAQAREVLVQSVLHLVQTIPLTEITARRIARQADTDPKTIFRCFPTLDDLFVAALRALEQRVVDDLARGAGAALTPLEISQVYVRYASWLYLSGISPAALAPSREVLDQLRRFTFERIGVPQEADERSQDALFVLLMSFLQAQVNAAPFLPEVFTPQAVADVVLLLRTLMGTLPGVSSDLGVET
jgi:AcrR family transcriptional regulator